MEILHNLNYLWLIAGALLIIFEFMILSGVGFLFAGLAALTVGALIEFGLVQSFTSQLIVFFASTLFWTLILWKPLKNYKLSHTHPPFTDIVGETAVLVSELAPGKTVQAKWSGTVMNAKLDPNNHKILAKGAEVEILRVEGNTLIVK